MDVRGGETSDSCGPRSSLTLGATGKVPSKPVVQLRIRLSSCDSGPMAEGQREAGPLTLGQEADCPGLVRSLLSLIPFNPEGLLCPQSRKSSKLRDDVSRSGQREEQKGPASLSQDTF